MTGSTVWWLLAGVVAAAARILARRLVRRGGRPAPTSPSAGGPAPGEIWWADVPFEDGTGSKVRPCLVL
ncbi:MAG TPA: hypothetical protein VGF17_11915, partial [Phytomonospora sp.]